MSNILSLVAKKLENKTQLYCTQLPYTLQYLREPHIFQRGGVMERMSVTYRP